MVYWRMSDPVFAMLTRVLTVLANRPMYVQINQIQ